MHRKPPRPPRARAPQVRPSPKRASLTHTSTPSSTSHSLATQSTFTEPHPLDPPQLQESSHPLKTPLVPSYTTPHRAESYSLISPPTSRSLSKPTPSLIPSSLAHTSSMIQFSYTQQTVVYDGQNTHIQAEQHQYQKGQQGQGAWQKKQAQAQMQGNQLNRVLSQMNPHSPFNAFFTPSSLLHSFDDESE